MKFQLFIIKDNNILWGEEISFDSVENLVSSIDLILREAVDDIN